MKCYQTAELISRTDLAQTTTEFTFWINSPRTISTWKFLPHQVVKDAQITTSMVIRQMRRDTGRGSRQRTNSSLTLYGLHQAALTGATVLVSSATKRKRRGLLHLVAMFEKRSRLLALLLVLLLLLELRRRLRPGNLSQASPRIPAAPE